MAELNAWYTIEIQFIIPVNDIGEDGEPAQRVGMTHEHARFTDLIFPFSKKLTLHMPGQFPPDEDYIAIIDTDGRRTTYPKSNLAWVDVMPENQLNEA